MCRELVYCIVQLSTTISCKHNSSRPITEVKLHWARLVCIWMGECLGTPRVVCNFSSSPFSCYSFAFFLSSGIDLRNWLRSTEYRMSQQIGSFDYYQLWRNTASRSKIAFSVPSMDFWKPPHHWSLVGLVLHYGGNTEHWPQFIYLLDEIKHTQKYIHLFRYSLSKLVCFICCVCVNSQSVNWNIASL